MSKYEPISKELHENKQWLAPSNFNFAKRDTICRLVMAEAPTAALYFPIAFSRVGEQYELFAVQGLEPQTNLLIDANGRWLSSYIPAAYRSYPFALAKSEEGQYVLCIHSNSSAIVESGGRRLFDEDGEPDASISETLNLLKHVSANKEATLALCLLLDQMELLEPWPITLKKGEKDVTVEGLFRINEAKLNELEASSLSVLQKNNGLLLIYSQILSMQHLPTLVKASTQTGPSSVTGKELSFDLAASDGNISFEGL